MIYPIKICMLFSMKFRKQKIRIISKFDSLEKLENSSDADSCNRNSELNSIPSFLVLSLKGF